jgi:serine/threonine-protein kinase
MEGENFMVGEERPAAIPDDRVGWVLPGYAHIRELGSGAGGHVWLARHSVSGTLVAVKYLVPGLHASADFRQAYRAEAQLLAELSSAHVTRLYEYVEGPAGAAIVMEAVEGCSLFALLRQEGAAVSPEAALTVLKGSLLGLAAAHEAGVVHRDYKPANVLVTPEGVSKLVDFGIAARTGSAAAAAGTPLYMAPEQFQGVPASPATDVYAATATFFECVTGERPFPGANAVELMAQHALGTIPDDLAPPPVRALIRKGMAKSPQERPGSAREFVDRLEEVAGTAYGADWEERGQHKLATLLALLPLLLLAGLQQGVPASTTSVATTFLGEEPLTVTIAPSESPQEPHQGSGRGGRREGHRALNEGGRRRGRRNSALSVGAGVMGVLLVVAGAAVAAYASSRPHTSQTNSATLTSATTLVTAAAGTASGTPSATMVPVPTMSVTASPTPSMSVSPSETPTITGSASPSSATTSSVAAATTTTTHATSSQTPTASQTTPAPAINSLSVTVSCPSSFTLEATVAVASNGQGGTVTFNWFYVTSDGLQQSAGTTSAGVSAGKTSQSVTSSKDFTSYSDYSTWGVTVTSSPAAGSGQGSSATIAQSTSNGCEPVIS